MKTSAYLINIGRGATVVLDDLVSALRDGDIAGAALDVFQVEPLPADHPLWTAPGVLITPHVAGSGPYLEERRAEVFLDNCVRFSEGRPLRNVVDKATLVLVWEAQGLGVVWGRTPGGTRTRAPGSGGQCSIR